ncbi:MAG: anhydro-N-acetylmuramic acid kinase [Flavobacteriaceae bacterium]|nr:anhydro-N-acetylmuramic acid kinase [Flavobacteriaceae bacterium]
MSSDFVYAIGLMSGTSLDGLDIVYVKFDKNNVEEFEILFTETVSYSDSWKERLQKGIQLPVEQIENLDVEYGVYLGIETQKFIKMNKINSIDFIASHGHTIFHQPEKGITLQIGNGQEISNRTNCKVICDFRAQDVQFGGQGAPLVPIGDQLLFSDYDACVNLGGFANISFKKEGERIAFDICPANIILNHFSRKLGLDFDDKGNVASKGVVDEKLLEELTKIPFYQLSPPKSLGLEWVHQFIFPLIDAREASVNTFLRTFIEHIAQQISTVIQPFEKILFTGGGVYNDFLISRISQIGKANIIIPSSEIIDYKESLIFALLGLLKLQGKVNCLSSVTGAKKNHSSGRIFNPNNSD